MSGFLWGLVSGVVGTIYVEGLTLIYKAERTSGSPPGEALRAALLWPLWALRR